MVSPLTRIRVVVHGGVQGVGFRWYVRDAAENLGLSGWVRNRWNGTVEIEAEGAKEDLARFEELLMSGPGNPARVESIETGSAVPKGEKGFTII